MTDRPNAADGPAPQGGVTATEDRLLTLIAHFRAEVHGELAGRTKVVDHLLDLRLAARDQATIAVIDRVLSELPGQTTVPNVWWVDALVGIERSHRGIELEIGEDLVLSLMPPPVSDPTDLPPPLPKRRPQG